MKNDYFNRFLTFYGIPIVAPSTVEDFALQEARWTLTKMFLETKHRIHEIYATNLFIAIVPELKSGIFDFGLENVRTIIIGEDHLIDRNAETSILIHEIGHAVHYACCEHEKQHIKTLYESRPFWGKADAYAQKNEHEYFAEGVTAYFDAGMPGEPVRNRLILQSFDPALYHTIDAIFEQNEWKWQPINERKVLSEHLLAAEMGKPPQNRKEMYYERR